MGIVDHDPYAFPGSPGRTTRPGDIAGIVSRSHNDDVADATVEDMRAMATLVEQQMSALKQIVERATAAGSATDIALKARQSLEAEWWDTKEATEDTKLISYQKTDAYIKRAATRMSGQRKWITNKNAGKTLAESLEELRLASLVLQQKHEEESVASEQLAKTSVALTGSVRAEHAAMSQLRVEMDPAVGAITSSMEELRRNLERAAAAAARRASRPAPTPAPEYRPAAEVPRIPQIVHTFVEKADDGSDPRLEEELRRARERADDAVLTLQRSQEAARRDQANLLEEIRQLRDALARERASASVLGAETDKWRTMYDAAKGDAGRDDGALAELEALRASVARAEERHRRELNALGLEHGAAHAELRRALSAAERRVAELEPAEEASEKRQRALEEQVRAERTRREDLEEEIGRIRGDLHRRGSQSRSATEETSRELARVRDELAATARRLEEERQRRERLERDVGASRAAADRSGDAGWRLSAAENEVKKLAEDLRAERAKVADLEPELARVTEQLRLARETVAAAAASDLPGVVASLEAELKRVKASRDAEIKSAEEIGAAEMRRVLGLHQAEMRSLKDIGDAETERLERELKRAKAGDAAKVADLEAEISRLAAEVERLERLRRAAAEGGDAEVAAVVAEMETLKKTHKNAVGELLGEIDALKRAYAKATADAEAFADAAEARERQRRRAADAAAADAAAEMERLRAEVTRLEKLLSERRVAPEDPEELARLRREAERARAAKEEAEAARERDAAAAERTLAAERKSAATASANERAATERAETALETSKMKLATLRWRLLGGPKDVPAAPEPTPPSPAPTPPSPDPELLRQIESRAKRVGQLEAELAAANKLAATHEAAMSLARAEADAANGEAAAASRDAAAAAEQAAAAHRRADAAAAEAADARRAAAANLPVVKPPSRPHTPAPPPPPAKVGDDADAARYYQQLYERASDDLAVLSLIVQEATRNHAWYKTPRRKALAFGQPPGPMARAAGRMAMRLVEPRIVAALWWEHLMFVVAAWVAVVLGFAYFSGNGFKAYPGVLLSPFIPTVVAWVMRAGYKMPLDPADGPRLALDAFHLVSVPLGFILLFCKLWDDAGEIPWAVVLLFPFLAVTRHLVETAHDLAFKMPRTVYASLGYGPPGSASEYAFTEPAEEEREIDLAPPPPPFSPQPTQRQPPAIAATAATAASPAAAASPAPTHLTSPAGDTFGRLPPSPAARSPSLSNRAGSFGSSLLRGRSGSASLDDVPRPGDHHTVSVDGVQFTNIESPPQTQPQPRT